MCTNNTNTLKCLIAERNKEKDRGRGKDEISCPQKFPDRLSKKKKKNSAPPWKIQPS